MQALQTSFRERVGTTLGEKYNLVRLVGVGGMAAVYEATNTWTGRRVAIKLLKSDTGGSEERVKRFLQEARAAAKIEHPNVVQVLDLGRDTADGTLYMVGEYLTGGDLRALLDERATLPPRAALEIMLPVMSGLSAAHKLGIVHRDIKPANIFLARTPDGEIVPKVIDFGVSKLAHSAAEITRTGTTVGTPEYMSPEQAHGDKTLDAQTDVWSTAVVLYEALSGRCPFQNENYHALLAQIIMGGVERLDEVAKGIPTALADVVHRALLRDRTRRYKTIDDFADALLACAGPRDEPWIKALASAYRAPPPSVPAADSARRMVSDAPPPAVPGMRENEPTYPDDEPTTMRVARAGGAAPPSVIEASTFDGEVPALSSGSVQAILTPPPSPASPASPATVSPPASAPPRRGALAWLAGLSVIAVLGFAGGYALLLARTDHTASPASPVAASAPVAPPAATAPTAAATPPPLEAPAAVVEPATPPSEPAPPVAQVNEDPTPAEPTPAEPATTEPATPRSNPTPAVHTGSRSRRRQTAVASQHASEAAARAQREAAARARHHRGVVRSTNGSPILGVP